MESPFQPYLDTNHVPSESERVQILHLLEGPSQEVRDIDSEIATLRQQIEALALKREERAQYIGRHRAILNPIRLLPEEILRAIFDCCVPERNPFPERNENNFMSAGEAPLVLTFVCRRWRQIVLDYPSMWDSPYVTVPLPLQDEARWDEMACSTAKLSGLWLSRAGKDRFINLTIVSSAPPYPSEGLRAILEAVAAHSKRWQALQLQVTKQLLDDMLSLPSAAVPNLQQLQLSTFHHQAKDIPALLRGDCLIGGPSLHNIALGGTRICEDSLHFLAVPIQWSQITALHVFSVMFEDVDILGVLSQAPAIQRACFRVYRCRLQGPLPAHRVALPNLTFLFLVSMGNIVHLLSSLHAPRLKTVDIATDQSGDALVAVAQLSSGGLRDLTIRSKAITTQELIRFLALSPELTALTLRYFPYHSPYESLITEELITRLTPHPTPLPSSPFDSTDPGKRDQGQENEEIPAILCPKLQQVGFHISTGPRIPDVAFLEFIRRRRGMKPQMLKSVSISDHRHDPEMEIMSELQKAGVDTRGLTVKLRYREREPEGTSALDL